MLKLTSEKVLEQIDQHWQNLLFVRSLSPYLKDNLVGARKIRTGTYYTHKEYKATLLFDEPLTQARIRRLNLATYWVAQGFIMRLHALLNYCCVCGDNVKINQKLKGWEEIDILRRLRNCFAHTDGFYDPSNNRSKKLYKKIISHFHLCEAGYAGSECRFPIHIESVLEPLVEGCKQYVAMLYCLEAAVTP